MGGFGFFWTCGTEDGIFVRRRSPVTVPSDGWVALGNTYFPIRIQAAEGMEIRRQTSVSSFAGSLDSFLGLRPGFGFAGITHSLEALKSDKTEGRERETTDNLNTYGQPTVSKKRAPRCRQQPWYDSESGR